MSPGNMDNDATILKRIETLLAGDSGMYAGFCSFLERSETVDLKKLVDEVDESNYSLHDWIESLLRFDDWLERKKVEKRDFCSMLGYLHCCTFVIPATVGSPSLKGVLQQCLNDHGYDAAEDSQK